MFSTLWCRSLSSRNITLNYVTWSGTAPGNRFRDTEMSTKLEFFITHMKRDVVHRFHCTRRLTECMDSKATFHMDLSVRNKNAEEIWDLMVELQGCCVFQLIGLGYRRERLGKGPAAPKDPRHTQVVVRHAFVNSGNRCYMSSLVQTITWAVYLSGTDVSEMGQGADFFRSIMMSEQQVDLMQVPGWQSIIAEWTEAHRQHDVCEFPTACAGTFTSSHLSGDMASTQTCSPEGAVRCIDQGRGTQALALHFPRLPPGLPATLEVQQLVDHWHKDHDRTVCFQVPPVLLFLQLMRFSRKRGQICKDRMEVQPNLSIYVPLFTDARLGRSNVCYKLAAYVVHHGLSPRSGHYTAHLVQDGEFRHCDDNRPAQLEVATRRSHHNVSSALHQTIMRVLVTMLEGPQGRW